MELYIIILIFATISYILCLPWMSVFEFWLGLVLTILLIYKELEAREICPFFALVNFINEIILETTSDETNQLSIEDLFERDFYNVDEAQQDENDANDGDHDETEEARIIDRSEVKKSVTFQEDVKVIQLPVISEDDESEPLKGYPKTENDAQPLEDQSSESLLIIHMNDATTDDDKTDEGEMGDEKSETASKQGKQALDVQDGIQDVADKEEDETEKKKKQWVLDDDTIITECDSDDEEETRCSKFSGACIMCCSRICD